MAMFIKSFYLLINNKVSEAIITIKPPEKMRWVDTCSCMGMPQYHTAVEGVVTRRYKVENEYYNRDPKRSCGNVRIECRLANGKIIDRFATEFYRGKDGILEYWN